MPLEQLDLVLAKWHFWNFKNARIKRVLQVDHRDVIRHALKQVVELFGTFDQVAGQQHLLDVLVVLQQLTDFLHPCNLVVA